MSRVFAALCVLFCLPVDADAPPPRGLSTVATVVRVLDGDTIEVDVRTRVKIRIKDCWAPETRTKNESEKQRGIASKSHLEELLPVGSELAVFIPMTGRIEDMLTFGRVVADVWKNGENVAELQVKAGHAQRSK